LLHRVRLPVGLWLDHPLRLFELADELEVDDAEMCVEHLAHGGVRLEELLARVARGLGVPARDREQRRRIADLAVEQRTTGSRRALQDLARADPGRGVLFDRVPGSEMDLEDELHLPTDRMTWLSRPVCCTSCTSRSATSRARFLLASGLE